MHLPSDFASLIYELFEFDFEPCMELDSDI